MTTAFLALLVGIMSAQVPAAMPAQAGTARISGRVTADDSKTPIAGARVVLFPQRPQIGAFTRPGETVTDQDGRFGFEGIAAGSYNLDVQKTGYVTFLTPLAGRIPSRWKPARTLRTSRCNCRRAPSSPGACSTPPVSRSPTSE